MTVKNATIAVGTSVPVAAHAIKTNVFISLPALTKTECTETAQDLPIMGTM